MAESSEFDNFNDELEEQVMRGNTEYFQRLQDTGELETLKTSPEVDLRYIAQVALVQKQIPILNLLYVNGILPDQISEQIIEGNEEGTTWVVNHNVDFLDTDLRPLDTTEKAIIWFFRSDLTRMLLRQGHRPTSNTFYIALDLGLTLDKIMEFLNIFAEFGVYPPSGVLGELVFYNFEDSERVLRWAQEKDLQITYDEFFLSRLQNELFLRSPIQKAIELGIRIPSFVFDKVLEEREFGLADELYNLGYRPSQRFVDTIYRLNYSPEIAEWLLRKGILSTRMLEIERQIPYYF